MFPVHPTRMETKANYYACFYQLGHFENINCFHRYGNLKKKFKCTFRRQVQKKANTASIHIERPYFKVTVRSFVVAQFSGCCGIFAKKKRTLPSLSTNKRVPHLMQIEPQKQELAILTSCFSSCKEAVQLKTRANGGRWNKRHESDKIRYFVITICCRS